MLVISTDDSKESSGEDHQQKMSSQISGVLKNKRITDAQARFEALKKIRLCLNTYMNKELNAEEFRILQGVLSKDFKKLEREKAHSEKLEKSMKNLQSKVMGFMSLTKAGQ